MTNHCTGQFARPMTQNNNHFQSPQLPVRPIEVLSALMGACENVHHIETIFCGHHQMKRFLWIWRHLVSFIPVWRIRIADGRDLLQFLLFRRLLLMNVKIHKESVHYLENEIQSFHLTRKLKFQNRLIRKKFHADESFSLYMKLKF